MDERYVRNIPTLTIEESNQLKNYTVCIIGCGGIGGYVIEMLARVGIGKLIIVDYDVFDRFNLNRQILSTERNIGNLKVLEAKKRLEEINPNVDVDIIIEQFTLQNGRNIVKQADVVVDALDSIESRLMLEKVCEEENITFIHGAIENWIGQVTTVYPGDKTLSTLYEQKKNISTGNPSFTPALVASIQVAEVIKYLINKGKCLRKKLLLIDLFNHHYEVIDI